MTKSLYDEGRDQFANGNIDWVNDTIKAILVDLADYTLNLSAHDFVDDVPAAARVATAALSGKSTSAGTVDASDLTFSSVTGDESEAIILYKDTGSEASSPLISFDDEASGLPVNPNGGDIRISWDDAADKIFTL